MIKLIDTYQEYQATFRRVTLSKQIRKPTALQEHQAILKAIDEEDAERAERLTREHLRAARDQYLCVFQARSVKGIDEA